MKITNKSELFKAAWQMFKVNKITFSEALNVLGISTKHIKRMKSTKQSKFRKKTKSLVKQ